MLEVVHIGAVLASFETRILYGLSDVKVQSNNVTSIVRTVVVTEFL